MEILFILEEFIKETLLDEAKCGRKKGKKKSASKKRTVSKGKKKSPSGGLSAATKATPSKPWAVVKKSKSNK